MGYGSRHTIVIYDVLDIACNILENIVALSLYLLIFCVGVDLNGYT